VVRHRPTPTDVNAVNDTRALPVRPYEDRDLTEPDTYVESSTVTGRRAVIAVAAALALIVCVLVANPPAWHRGLRLFTDRDFLVQTLGLTHRWGPIAFVALQALQVIIAPIPGDVTTPVGGLLFGTTLGVLYSTIGLTGGTLLCFWVGRTWGEPLIRRWLSAEQWRRLHFVLSSNGALLCFVLYLIPGFPKDVISYLFGLSPMRFTTFALASTAGRLPGTWLSSYVGANVAEGAYTSAAMTVVIAIVISVPLYRYRHAIVRAIRRRSGQSVSDPRRGAAGDGVDC
jgi:uncharacterized membrane protein YdjX (TVP38/TMEM64 family)